MANFTEQFVALTIATLKADGKERLDELGAILALAEGLELDKDEVENLIRQETQNTKRDLIEVAKSVTDMHDKEALMEACTIVALSDNELAEKEVDLLTTICNALGLSTSKMVLAIASVAQNNRDIKIAGNNNNFAEDEIIVED